MPKTAGVICVPVVLIAAVLASCSSSSGRAVPPPATTSTSTSPTTVAGPPTPVATLAARDSLEFREVLGTFPNSGATASVNSCQTGPTATTAAANSASAPLVLPDPAAKTCYLLGPSLLNGRDLASASVEIDPTTNAPEVELHFAGNAFVAKVAQPMANQQVAIIFEGVVESLPTINAGITSNVVPIVPIAGDFTQAAAEAIVQKLS